ncbi:MAG: SpoIIE family protein phosphatase [Bacteroidia bacterium]
MKTIKKINIFIVDDNKLFVLALKAAIENAFKNTRVRIHAFDSGEACMRIFMKIMPELVILDYTLNSKNPAAVDGLEVLDKIKKCNFATSVIMLTSNEHIEIALKSFHHGAADYVVKTESPFKKINHSISLIFAKKELDFQNDIKAKQAVELMISSREKSFKSTEKIKHIAAQNIANKELDFQNEEKAKRVAELILVNGQKTEIEKSKRIIENKNKDITDSILYAKRIQQAKLPRKEDIYSALPNCFVLFKPKDIVSGDFYFFYKDSKSLFIAAADCTGHGVPGAFMSMIASEKLTDAVSASTDTSDILKRLNKGIKTSLRQTENSESSKDGMDIALCSVNMESRIIKYAGANRPLWIIHKGKDVVDEIKATKKGIGGFTEDDQHFETHEVKLQEGDTFYIFSDGYADTFGGKLGKKLMTGRFKEILLSIQKLSMQEQEKHLEYFLENWKAGIEQVDDILVIGIRL